MTGWTWRWKVNKCTSWANISDRNNTCGTISIIYLMVDGIFDEHIGQFRSRRNSIKWLFLRLKCQELAIRVCRMPKTLAVVRYDIYNLRYWQNYRFLAKKIDRNFRIVNFWQKHKSTNTIASVIEIKLHVYKKRCGTITKLYGKFWYILALLRSPLTNLTHKFSNKYLWSLKFIMQQKKTQPKILAYLEFRNR